MTERNKGEVITFYSYKGGVGRTMALANVACYLARCLENTGERVLMIDWDLEAPGLQRFFGDEIDFNRVKTRPGVIDYFGQIKKRLDSQRSDAQTDDSLLARELVGSVSLTEYILKDVALRVDLMKAGSFDSTYSERVNDFDWKQLYEQCQCLFSSFIHVLAQEYAYILIDSRTGETDVAGICTFLLPERLVAVFTPNHQSIEGVGRVVSQCIQHRRHSEDLRPLLVFPLPSRIESAEPTLREAWRSGSDDKRLTGYQPLFEEKFKQGYRLKNCDLTEYFNDVQIQHVPRFAYGEQIAVLSTQNVDRLSLAKSFEDFCDRLTSEAPPWEQNTLFSVVNRLKNETIQSLMRGEFTAASDLAQRLVAINRIDVSGFKESRMLAEALGIVADTSIPLGRLDDAIQALIEAYKLSETSSPSRWIPLARQMVDIYLWQGEFELARKTVEEMLNRTYATNNRRMTFDALNALRQVNTATIEAESIQDFFVRNLESDDDDNLIASLEMKSKEIKRTQAELLASQSEYLFLSEPASSDKVIFSKNAAGTHAQEIVDIPKAVLSFERELDSRETAGMAEFEFALGNYDEAEGLCRKVIKRCEKSKAVESRASRAETHQILGAIHMEKGHVDNAERAFEQAVNLLDRGSDSNDPKLGFALAEQGRMYLRNGKANEAYDALSRSLGIQERVLGASSDRVAACLAFLGRAAVSADKSRLSSDLTKSIDRLFIVFWKSQQQGGDQNVESVVKEAKSTESVMGRCKTKYALQRLIDIGQKTLESE